MKEQKDRYADHECDEGENCAIERAKVWVRKLAAKGFPQMEIRDLHIENSIAAAKIADLEDQVNTYAGALAAVVSRQGGHVCIKESELDLIEGESLRLEPSEHGTELVVRIHNAVKPEHLS